MEYALVNSGPDMFMKVQSCAGSARYLVIFHRIKFPAHVIIVNNCHERGLQASFEWIVEDIHDTFTFIDSKHKNEYTIFFSNSNSIWYHSNALVISVSNFLFRKLHGPAIFMSD